MVQNQDQIDKILEERRVIRAKERSFRRSRLKKENNVNIVNTLQEKLKAVLPKHLLPGNVGDLKEVTWPFYHKTTFDFGTNPTWLPTTRATQSFQVTQEAGLLLMAISRKPWDSTGAGDRAPLQISISDRQSSRQFNNSPIPIQSIGKKRWPTILPTSYFFVPNAFVDITMTSFIPTGETMTTVGNGKHEFSFFGYRIRAEDTASIMAAIYG